MWGEGQKGALVRKSLTPASQWRILLSEDFSVAFWIFIGYVRNTEVHVRNFRRVVPILNVSVGIRCLFKDVLLHQQFM
jgi:hypothetical protein